MSRTSYADLYIAGPSFKPLDILELFIQNGWTLDDFGYITYLPLGDNDEFNWERTPIAEKEKVMSLLLKKDELGEPIGITLLWSETEIGCSFIIDKKERRFTVSFNINRKELENSRFTDISWYLNRLVSPLSNSYKIERIAWNELI